MQRATREHKNLNGLADNLTDKLESVLDDISDSREVENRKANCPYSPHLAKIDLKLCYHEKMLKWIIGLVLGGFSLVVTIMLAWMALLIG